MVEYIFGEEMERQGYKREHPRSHKKPLRLSWHEWLARCQSTARAGFRKATAKIRRSTVHRREELRYTRSKESA